MAAKYPKNSEGKSKWLQLIFPGTKVLFIFRCSKIGNFTAAKDEKYFIRNDFCILAQVSCLYCTHCEQNSAVIYFFCSHCAIQYTLDLVTLLVSEKTVTKSHNVIILPNKLKNGLLKNQPLNCSLTLNQILLNLDSTVLRYIVQYLDRVFWSRPNPV